MTKNKGGRASKYSEEIAEEICSRIADGESMRTMCLDKDMPDRSTVLRWLGEHQPFATKYARAREAQADFMDDRILEVADNCTSETAMADRVKIGAYQWRASKLAPKKYGDKLELAGAGGGPLQVQVVRFTEDGK